MIRLLEKALAYFDSSRWTNEKPDFSSVTRVPFTRTKQDQIIDLFWFDGVSPKQIAIELGYSEIVVRSVLKKRGRIFYT